MTFRSAKLAALALALPFAISAAPAKADCDYGCGRYQRSYYDADDCGSSCRRVYYSRSYYDGDDCRRSTRYYGTSYYAPYYGSVVYGYGPRYHYSNERFYHRDGRRTRYFLNVFGYRRGG